MGTTTTPGIESLVTEKDIQQYLERGFWISPKLLTDEQIARLNRAHERIWSGEIDGEGFYYEGKAVETDFLSPAIRKLVNGWWINDEVRLAALSSLIGKVSAALMRCPAARLWHDQVIEKPGAGSGEAGLSGNVGWHQDYAYWQCTDTTNMISAWVALQDTDLSNGAMMTLVGSHHWGVLSDSASFKDLDLSALRRRFEPQMKGGAWVEEPCNLKAGQVSFHHALCLHGSGPNTTNKPRRCITIHAMPDGTAYKRQLPPGSKPAQAYHTNVRLLGPRPHTGQKFDNSYFPLLNDPTYEAEVLRELR